MQEDFEDALKFTLQYEGGYSNHPNDRGGPTNCGVTQVVYNEYRLGKKQPLQSVRNITSQEISNIYYEKYWQPIGGEELPTPLAIAAFDFAVHSGVDRAKRYLLLSENDLSKYLSLRKTFLENLAKTPSQSVFKNGWMSRIDALYKLLKI